MKVRYSKSFSLVGAMTVVLLPGLLHVACAELNEEFKKQLLRTRNKSISTNTLEARTLLEVNCLKLVKDHNSPAEKGMIYATITLLYARKGFKSPSEKGARLAKIFEYGKKALEHPIPDVLISCEVHGRLAGALFVKAKEGPQEEFAESRRKAIVPCLKGLKLALDNKAPKERPKPPPRWTIAHSITPNGAAYKKKLAEEQAQAAEWERWRHFDDLYDRRNALTERCLTMYSEEPYDTQEFREHAQKILRGYGDVVNDLVGQVEKRISAMKRSITRR